MLESKSSYALGDTRMELSSSICTEICPGPLFKCVPLQYTVVLKRKGFWLDTDDETAIELLKKRYGAESDSQVVRLALRVLAESSHLEVVLPPKPLHSRKSPKL